LRLLHLPIEIQQLIEKEELSLGHAKVLLALATPESQIRLAKQIVAGQLSVRDAEQFVEREARKGRKRGRSLRHRVASDVEQQLQKRLGTRVNIVRRGRGGQIIIHFFSGEELDGLLEALLN
jgi:ParB family chromosome partitioning protein